jgi:hypothetical protein
MILENLRDTHPTMFGPRTKHQKRMAKAQALAHKRRANLDQRTGTGKRQKLAQRFAKAREGWLLLFLSPQIQALAEAKNRLASDGGSEASK